MKLRTLSYTSFFLLSPLLVQAGVVTLVTGTPGDGAKPTLLSPSVGTLFNFSNLTTNSACQGGDITQCPGFNPAQYAAQGVNISSPDGLVVYPFSVQNGPNELFDNSADGSSNITIALSSGVSAIGVGIADSDDRTLNGDPTDQVQITLQALALGGGDLGPAFTVTTPTTGDPITVFNGYWAVEDPTAEIFGLKISTTATDESGLAIADVQVSPEPSSFLLLMGGAAIMAMAGSYKLRKKA